MNLNDTKAPKFFFFAREREREWWKVCSSSVTRVKLLERRKIQYRGGRNLVLRKIRTPLLLTSKIKGTSTLVEFSFFSLPFDSTRNHDFFFLFFSKRETD